MKIWKWIITWWLKFNPPNLKRSVRIGWYPLGTKYVAPDGRVYRYMRKIKMSKTPIGGHKRKSWRLKKKYRKWFSFKVCEVIIETVREFPQGFLEGAFANLTYDITRIYKK